MRWSTLRCDAIAIPDSAMRGHPEPPRNEDEGVRLAFRVEGLDCADEVAVLRREVGRVVGGAHRLAFDVLSNRMMVLESGGPVTADEITAAVRRTGMTATKSVYLRWQKDPFHASLDFKRISRKLPVYSIRIGRSGRALGQRKGDTVTWFWIGSHEAYNTLLNEL